MILPSEMLKEMVDEIVSIDRSNTVLISVSLRNHTDSSFVIDDAFVTTFKIKQNTLNNVFDDITLTADITPKQFQQLITKQSDLYADIVIEYANRQTNEPILDESPIVLRYKVLLHDMSSLMKKYGASAFESSDDKTLPQSDDNSTRVSISMQLMTETDHKVNRGSFVGMIQDITVEDAIRYIASVLKIPQIKMVDPDNKNKFQHMSIPPENSGFRVVFDYIHKKQGVYANGFRYYLTNGTLYVYPPFNMESEETPKLIVLRVSENSYGGSTNYHKVEKNKNITIVSNSKMDAKNLSNVGSENDGNTKVFVRADGMIDGQVSKGKSMKLTNVTASISSKNDSSISKDAAIPKYVQPTLNVYDQGSTFSEANTEMITLGWSNSRLNLIHPSMPVSFVFDEKNKVMEKSGLIEVIEYEFTSATRHLFVCHTVLVLRVDPKQEEYNA